MTEARRPPRLVLASSSPRRADILRRLSLRFEIRPPSVVEELRPGEPPRAAAERLAREKAASRVSPGTLTVGCDTLVVDGTSVLGKPAGAREAVEMLLRLAGRPHIVHTGIALSAPDRLDASRATTSTSWDSRCSAFWSFSGGSAGGTPSASCGRRNDHAERRRPPSPSWRRWNAPRRTARISSEAHASYLYRMKRERTAGESREREKAWDPFDFFQGRRPLLVVAGFLLWTALGLFEAILHIMYQGIEGQQARLGSHLWRILPRWYLWGLLMPVVIWLARRFPLHHGLRRSLLLVHLPAGLALTASHVLAWLFLRYRYIQPPVIPISFSDFVGRVFAPFFALDFMVYWAILGSYFAVYYVRRLRVRETEGARLELETSQLEAKLVRARLQVLSSQLQPHFLFNTLNAVSELIATRPRVAEQIVVRLGDLLRRLIDLESVQEVELREELELVKAYLDIEKLRFGECLETWVQGEEEVMKARVPTLCLQPLVENAIRHGIAPRQPVGGRLEVVAWAEGGRLRVEVRDDGVGLSRKDLPPEGIGLHHTRQRLRSLYGPEARLELSSRRGGGTVASIALPLLPGSAAGRPTPAPQASRGPTVPGEGG